MSSESQREVRSFLVSRDPSVDRRFRPRPERQVRLFEGINEITSENEISSDEENYAPEASSEINSVNSLNSDVGSESSESAFVYLRMRPLQSPSPTYDARGNVLVVKPSSESSSTSNNKNSIEKHFAFTDIFHPDIPQASVYENCARMQIDLEESFTILTYGTSGSGKTYTLLGDENNPGMVPRALEQIFTMYEPNIYPSPSIKLINGRVTLIEDNELLPDLELRKRLFHNLVETPEMRETRIKISNDHHFTVMKDEGTSVLIWITFVEIYNENVHDLLKPTMETTQMAPPPRNNLKILGNDGKVFIKGVTSVYVRSSVEALYLLRYGLQRVSYASTSINKNSSRSHCIFTVDVVKLFRSGQYTETSYKFCDLAGSERIQKTRNVGSRLKEAQSINTSLLVLGRCLDAVTSSRKKGNDVIPFRESKLTMLLQAALLGKERLTMLVNVMPTEKYYEENLNVLNFASIAKNIVFTQRATKAQKRRCSFFLEYKQTEAGTISNNQIQQLLEENIFLRSEVGRLTSTIEELKNSHAVELFNLEREIRIKLTDSHQETINKIKKHNEERIKIELEKQKLQLESKFQSTIRKQEWEIEDLKEEMDDLREEIEELKKETEYKTPTKRRTLE